jgi:uncharacterized protein
MAELNPFIYDKPLPPEQLIDREDEASKLLTLAEGGHNSRLSAPRRYGKTTLLRKVIADADRAGMVPVYVDFSGVLTVADVALNIEEAYRQSLTGAVRRFVDDVLRTLRPRASVGTPAARLEVELQPDDELMRRLHRLLDLPSRVHERQGQRVLVIFDEFQEALSAGHGIDGVIRGRIQHHTEAASYIFAGSHPGLMAELFDDRERPLFGQARGVELGPLLDADLGDYIGHVFEQTGREVGAMLEPLLDLVRGHPQRAMLVSHHLWEETLRGADADEEVWGQALETVFRELREAFELAWRGLADGQRRVLSAVAGRQDSLYAADTLKRFQLTKGSAQKAASALLKRGDLQRTESDSLQLVDPLFESWIARERLA